MKLHRFRNYKQSTSREMYFPVTINGCYIIQNHGTGSAREENLPQVTLAE